ncbi:MAG: SUMF1/EgtB/PvdO family nonheme iron enzyme [Planctomycetota bacterium]
MSLDAPAASNEGRTPSGASSELLRRLSEHSLNESRYTLEGEVARGGMGAILRVWDADLRRHLAMKVILGRGDSPASGGTPQVDATQLARFLEEAQVTGQLDHPGIVPVHELGLDSEGRVYFTMKLVKGRDLKHVFDLVFESKEGWNETRALSVILRACEAMAYAHKKGVIHRDLKPANIMVGNFGEVYVMDWGLARVLGQKDRHDIRIAPEFESSLASVKTERRDEREELSDSPIVTMDGDVMGTPAYMSPEQARGEIEKLGPRSDVYSMGALLYQLLGRRAPYIPAGVRVSNRTVLQSVLEGAPKRLHDIRGEVPAELVAIVEKAMAREASKRYADTLALAEDLRAYLEHRVVGAYEAGAWAETKKWVQRNKPLAASLAGVIVLLAGGLTTSLIFKARADQNAARADESAALASRRADETAEQARIAKSNEQTAKEQEALAKREKSNVLRLSAFQTLDDLTAEADALWPAEPALVERYRAWMAKAETLVAKIAEFRESLVGIEQRALPQTDEERDAERQSHPRLAELEQKAAQHLWLSRMLGEAAWPSESSVEAELSTDTPNFVSAQAADANALNGLAWTLVDPEKPVYGSEVKALLLARRAVALSSDTERTANRDTLAWALFRLGRFDEALAEGRRALDEVESAKKPEYEGYVAKLESAVKRWQGDGRAERVKERDSLTQDVSALEAEVSKRRNWRFADDDDRWWHAQMEKLVAALSAFGDDQQGLMRGISAERGWGVAKRLEFAASIDERSVSGPDARTRWDEAIGAIASSPKYGGLKLAPQLGLLPIGADPESGLWEFAHLQTGEPALRGADGKLVLSESMGLVFVLIPGGTFAMGAQSTDPTGPNYDPQADSTESPVHDVTLSPYFLSKYEMTQGQWLRFVSRNPSQYGPSTDLAGHRHDLLHPVEQVTWTQCVEVMTRLGLSLPSEAQWENGCRGGTDSPWWTGVDRESLRGNVNLADQSAARAGATWQEIKDWPELEDGWAVHAAVGSFPANAFGLHEVHGNVWEWCRDGFDNYSDVQQRDPVVPTEGAQNRVNRGGGFFNAASSARSAIRFNYTPEFQNSALGLRPARASQLATSPLHPPVK